MDKYKIDQFCKCDNDYDKKVFLSKLLGFKENEINILHDFIEYNNDNYIPTYTKKPQWFHSAGGVYTILNNPDKYNNKLINDLIIAGKKDEIMQFCIDLMLLDSYGSKHINIMKKTFNDCIVIDQKNDIIIDTENNNKINISLNDNKIETVIEKINNI